MIQRVPPKHFLKRPIPWIELFATIGGWWIYALAVVCVIATFVSYGIYRKAAEYDRVGIETQATIVDRRIDYGTGDDSDTYYLTFEFFGSGQVVVRERSVGSSLYNSKQIGAKQVVRYLPDTPVKFEAFVGQSLQNARVAQFVAGVAGVIGLGALWFLGQKANKLILARRMGYAAVATVTTIVERKNSGKPTGRGYMRFRIEDGSTGDSLDHPIADLRRIGIGNQINVFVRQGDVIWEGDVGPRENRPAFPKAGA